MKNIKILSLALAGITLLSAVPVNAYELEDGYSKELYKDVCSEYIREIKRELEETSVVIRNELSVS